MVKRLIQKGKSVGYSSIHLGLSLIIAVLLSILPPFADNSAAGQQNHFPQIKPFPKKSNFRGISASIVCKLSSPTKASIAHRAGKSTKVRNLKLSDLTKIRTRSGRRVKIAELSKVCIDKYLKVDGGDKNFDGTATPSPTPSPTFTTIPSPTPTATPDPESTLPTPCDVNLNGCTRITKSASDGNFGDAANIFGGRFTDRTKVIIQEINDNDEPILGTRKVASILAIHDGMIQFRLPNKSAPRTLLAVWTDTDGLTSPAHFLNKPQIQSISDHSVRIGGTLTIWGDLLSLSDSDLSKSSVYLVSDVTRYKAPILNGSQFSLTVSIPSSLPLGTQYSVVVSNGLGRTLSESSSRDKVTALAESLDPLGLGAGWASEVNYLGNVLNAKNDVRLPLHPVGDGVADDSIAIQSGLDYVGLHGGGVLYLPQGTYRLSQPLKINHSKVLLQGAGKTQTSLLYGSIPSSENYAVAFAENNVSLSGVTKLRIINENSSRSLNKTIINYSKTGIHKIFVLDTAILANKGVGPAFSEIEDLIFRRNTITQSVQWNYTGTLDGPFHASKVDRLNFSDNQISYKIGRVHIVQSKNARIQNNHLIVDGSDSNLRTLIADRALTGNLNEVGGLELGFSTDTSVIGNDIEVSPIPDLSDPDVRYFYGLSFELIMTQTSIYHFHKMGEVSSIVGSKIYDTSKNWSTGDLEPPLGMRPFLTITNGPGIGQSREIIGYMGSEMTLSSPFDVQPVSGQSSYVISYWVNDNLLIQDNDLKGGHSAVVIYDGGRDVSIRRNFVLDSGTIYVHGKDLDPNGSRNYLRYIASNISITDNSSQSTFGNYGANIRVATYQHLNQVLHGMSVFNVEILRNHLVARTPSTIPNEWADFDGVIHTVVGGAGHDTTGQSAYSGPLVSVYGAIVTNNSSQGGPALPNGKTLYKTPGIYALIEEENSFTPPN